MPLRSHFSPNAAAREAPVPPTNRAFARRGGFALPIALGVAAFVLALVLAMAGLVRHGLDAPMRARYQARAAAALAIDAALDKLSAVAGDDRVATISAALSSSGETEWVGACAAGETAPTWLVSGDNPSPTIGGDVAFDSGVTAPSVETPFGSYAYYIEDLSQRVCADKTDPLDSLDVCWDDDPALLRHQALPAPDSAALDESIATEINWGVLSNPIAGGLKADLDTSSDALWSRIALWRDDDSFKIGRPLIWAEMALMGGVYQGDDNYPSLGLAFWADAWNPYTQTLPFNAKGTADLHLKISGPTGTANFYDIDKNLLFSVPIDFATHTATTPQAVDLYGSMTPGEVRFITHYRKLAISNQKRADITYTNISFPAGTWNFTFETFDGEEIQKISEIPFAAFATPIKLYKNIAADSIRQANSQFLFHFKLQGDLDAVLAQVDPRWQTLPYGDKVFAVDSSPVDALGTSIFPSGDTLKDGAKKVLFDLPEGSLVSVGALRDFYLQGVPARALGSAAGVVGNELFDSAFFSSLARAPAGWVPSGPTTQLPNPHLRLWGDPSSSELLADPAAHLLLRGAFNINTLSADAWARELPNTRYGMLFSDTILAPNSAISAATKQAWASAIVARLRARATPWRSLSEFASEDLLPADVLGQISPFLTVRGDTFRVHVIARSPSGDATSTALALVQRIPTPTAAGATSRAFRVLKTSFQ